MTKKEGVISASIIVGLITFWLLLLHFTGGVSPKIPALQTTPDRPLQTVTSPVPAPSVPVPRVERTPHKPTSQSLVIYVVAPKLASKWGLDYVLAGWKDAKYTDFKKVSSCPVASICVQVKENKSIPAEDAGMTGFGYSGDIYMDLNPAITNPFEAQSTVCHEFGHVLGLGHITGTHNSCMPAKGDYRILPSELDIRMVDRLGHWQLEKMYTSSGKTVDIRDLPK